MIPESQANRYRIRRDAKLDEMADVSARVRAIVDAVENLAHELDMVDQISSQEQVAQEIEPGLGVVVVTGDGVLVDVRLDSRAIKMSNAALLGQRILTAIQAAKERGHRDRERRIREVSASAHLFE